VLSNCQDYEVFHATVGETDILTGQLVMAQPAGGVLFKSPNNSTWEAMLKSDLKYRIYKSNFENDCQIVFHQLTGIEASDLCLRVEQFLGQSVGVSWSYSLDAENWVPFLPGINTSLESVITGCYLRCDVTSAQGLFRIIDKYMGVLFMLNKENGDYIMNQMEFPDPTALPNKVICTVDLDTDGVNGQGATTNVAAYYSIDNGDTWVEMTVPEGYTPITKVVPLREFRFETPDSVNVGSASAATPIVVTVSNHGYKDNAIVDIAGVVDGDENPTAANGRWRVKNATTNTLELVDPVTGEDSVGDAEGTGGTMTLAEFNKCRGRLNLKTTNKARSPEAGPPKFYCSEAA
jgi:hypothetical protein